jgi:hypothetical protein
MVRTQIHTAEKHLAGALKMHHFSKPVGYGGESVREKGTNLGTGTRTLKKCDVVFVL